DIKILFNEKEISFIKNDKNITLQVKENGEYQIIINDRELIIPINQIDPYALELVEVQNYGNYLELITNDELSKMNYEQSYVEYKGNKYTITRNLKVIGIFSGDVTIVIFNNDNQYMTYHINTY
ncbi:MAG: hypothetical protein ACK5LC_03900, partial [Coprobacillaceae bacterium]